MDLAPQSGPQAPPAQSATFAAVGRTREFAPNAAFWLEPNDGLHFLFELHGFAPLATYCAGPRSASADHFWSDVLDSWLRQAGTPALPAWHPYPTSGRIIAWCAALSAGGWGSELHQRLLRSLFSQARMLARCVEFDVGGNHLLRNAIALAIAGSCLDNAALRRLGLAILERELRAQLLDDGGHEERSPSYHRALLFSLRDLQDVLARPPDWLAVAIARMEGWLAALAGPDGTLPLLNDAWEAPALAPDRRSLVDLAATGYVVLRHGLSQAIVDVAPLGPAHLPAHAHADALAFVLWDEGSPLIVDSGSFSYSGPERDEFRCTAAHNTLEVDGQDQCDLWGPFRAAAMPRVSRTPIRCEAGAVIVQAEHDGYRRLDDPVRHSRTFCWLPGDGLIVIDRLTACRSHVAATRLHLAPGVGLENGRLGRLKLEALGPGPGPVAGEGRYSPFLGESVPNLVIERRLEAQPGVPFGWSLLSSDADAWLDGQTLTVTRAGGRDIRIEV